MSELSMSAFWISIPNLSEIFMSWTQSSTLSTEKQSDVFKDSELPEQEDVCTMDVCPWSGFHFCSPYSESQMK